jgi:glycyl-tRNA synthetase beta chain
MNAACERRELFVEVGCEELPYRWGAIAREALLRNLLVLLAGVPHGESRTWATPRRVAVSIRDVAEGRPEVRKIVTGPPVERAFADGRPTPAAIGFARAKGRNPEDLLLVDTPRGRVIALEVSEGGGKSAALVAAGLEAAIRDIPFPKTLRWGTRPFRWARPIHWVTALYDGERIEAEVAGLPTVTESRGNRRHGEPFPVTGSEGWLADLALRGVCADVAVRRERIRVDLEAAAAGLGVRLDLSDARDLLDEVTDLVEWPVVVAGMLPSALMDLPPRLLKESMRVHQRIFPTMTADGKLGPSFLAVSNNPEGDTAIIAAGNARVLGARFQDARFFFEEDRSVRLEEHGKKLDRMQWVRGLGTMADKTARIGRLGVALALRFGADPDRVARVAALCKADLTTQMVGEFPELQGHMGRLYAASQGMETELALAIEEHWLPRFAGDALPTTPEGRVLALADRLDTLVGCFGIGLVPQGSADPQGLRRAAIGLLAILRDARVPVELGGLADEALVALSGVLKAPPTDLRRDLVDFLLARFRAQAQIEGAPTEVVDAVLAAGGTDPIALSSRIQALFELASKPEFEPLRVAFRRVMGLSKDHDSPDFDASVLEEPAELALVLAFQGVKGRVAEAVARGDHALALALLTTLKPPVDAFFDKVLVMVDDPILRRSRLGLLRAIGDLFRSIADFTRLSGEAM